MSASNCAIITNPEVVPSSSHTHKPFPYDPSYKLSYPIPVLPSNTFKEVSSPKFCMFYLYYAYKLHVQVIKTTNFIPLL